MEVKKDNGTKENSIENIKSIYLLQQIFNFLQENKSLKITKYNKKIQKRLDKNINDYINYKKVIIEIIPINIKDINIFINYKEEKRKYYHIYFNDEKEEKSRNYFTKDEKVLKIKIIIDYQIMSFEELFKFNSFNEDHL